MVVIKGAECRAHAWNPACAVSCVDTFPALCVTFQYEFHRKLWGLFYFTKTNSLFTATEILFNQFHSIFWLSQGLSHCQVKDFLQICLFWCWDLFSQYLCNKYLLVSSAKLKRSRFITQNQQCWTLWLRPKPHTCTQRCSADSSVLVFTLGRNC